MEKAAAIESETITNLRQELKACQESNETLSNRVYLLGDLLRAETKKLKVLNETLAGGRVLSAWEGATGAHAQAGGGPKKRKSKKTRKQRRRKSRR